MLLTDIAAQARHSPNVESDIAAITDCGGRFAGSESEQRAKSWLLHRLNDVPGIQVEEQHFQYQGWRRKQATLALLGKEKVKLSCNALVWSPNSPPGDVKTEVVNVGRGTMDDFDRLTRHLKGKIALVQHEYPFAHDTIHRRVKYNRARDEGCAAFIIANYLPEAGLVTGSSGLGEKNEIPALGVSYQTGCLLKANEQTAQVELSIENERYAGRGANIVAGLAGRSTETIVLCAHYDGHELAESALDNATGIAAVLSVLECLLPHAASFRRNLRVIFFTNEEWRLFGSQTYTASLGEAELRNIALVINADSLAGSHRLSALISGFDEMSAVVREVGSSLDRDIGVVPQLLANSDHYNFAIRGIPALRLLAGYDDPSASTRYLLTEADTRDKVELDQLREATAVVGALTYHALTALSLPKHKPASVPV